MSKDSVIPTDPELAEGEWRDLPHHILLEDFSTSPAKGEASLEMTMENYEIFYWSRPSGIYHEGADQVLAHLSWA